MEAELDLEDAQALKDAPMKAPIDPVDAKIERANRLRQLDNSLAARQLLYQVLEEGDESQRRVARNILNQFDEV
jgi:sec-independent protein translocase protein TatC